MRRPDLLRALILSTALACLSACATTVARAPAPTPTGTAPSLADVLAVAKSQELGLQAFRAQARLDYQSPEQSFRSKQVIVVHGPASTRIDVMNPFGVSYTVATDGRQLTAYDRRQGVYYSGLAEPESFRRFIGIPMEATDFADVLRGLSPGMGGSRWSVIVAAEGGWLLRRRLGSGGVLKLVVDETTLLPIRVKISEDRDRPDVEVHFHDHEDVDGILVPHRIEARFQDGGDLDLVYKSVQREVVLADEAFRVQKPAGARFVNIDAGDAGDQALPAGDQAPPAGDEAPPAGDQAPPAGDQAPPAGDQAPPAGDEETPPAVEAGDDDAT